MANAEAARRQPALIVGDMSMKLQEAGVEFDVACSSWTDVGGTQPTCTAAFNPRRTDWLLANPAMQERVSSVEVDWGSGVLTHGLQRVGGAPLQGAGAAMLGTDPCLASTQR